MINWPTAFVITVIVLSGVVTLGRPTMGSGDDDGGVAVVATTNQSGSAAWQVSGERLRFCYIGSGEVHCLPWK